ncbi:MAG: GFA family protein [Thermodesulfobacteriota bacterium]
MSNTIKAEGKCLCGAVKFTAEEAAKSVGVCHCDMCRRWGGGPFMATGCGSKVDFEGADNIEVFDSSDWAERGFCRKCGTHLFYRIKRNGAHMMTAGLFGGSVPFELTHEVFVDEKPGFYDFSGNTEKMTGKECFEKFKAE